MHSGDRPFLCDHYGCNKTFATSSNLIKHKRARHKRKDE
ncbi:C2H2-type zinc finger protein [Sansalvadorimonas verongulae]